MPPRRKKQSKRSSAVKNAAALATPTEEFVKTEGPAPGNRGGIQDMPDLPLDVLKEIFTTIHPRDLLNLARTSKTFHGFLSSRASQPLWKASISAVEGLPQCPPFMSEPAYVDLVFFSHCNSCLKTDNVAEYFAAPGRLCSSCRMDWQAGHSEVTESIRKVQLSSEESSKILHDALIDHPRGVGKSFRPWPKAQLQQFSVRWDELTDKAEKEALVKDLVSRIQQVSEAELNHQNWKVATLHAPLQAFADAYTTFRGSPIQRDGHLDLEPHAMDLAVTHEFRAILDVPAGPADLSILQDADVMRDRFHAAIAKWQQDRKDELTALARAAIRVPKHVDPLTLYSVRFTCSKCDRVDLQYPAVVAHICARTSRESVEGAYASAVRKFWARDPWQSPWSSMHLSASGKAVSKLLKPILKACGLDVARAMYEDVKKQGAWLLCPPCNREPSFKEEVWGEKPPSYYIAYECEDALQHAIGSARKNERAGHRWVRVTSEGEVEALQNGQRDGVQIACDQINWTRVLHGCKYCEYASPLRRMAYHLRDCHDMGPEDDDDGDGGGGGYFDYSEYSGHCYHHLDAELKPMPRLYLRRYPNGEVDAFYDPISHY